MVTTSGSALLLLLVSFLLLVLWPVTFKLTGSRARFELFSLDFALGLLLFGAIIANVGTDSSFADRILLSSRTSQAYAVGSGLLFAFANILLLAAVSLLGLSFALPLTIASSVLVLAGLAFAPYRALLVGLAILTAILALVFASRGAAQGKGGASGAVAPPPPKKGAGRPRPSANVGLSAATKGTIAAVVAGLLMGSAFPLLRLAVNGAFGVGPFAGMLIFALGALGATVVLSFLLQNIPIHGPALPLVSYLKMKIPHHVFGILSGIFFSAACFCGFMVSNAADAVQPELFLQILLPLGAGLIAAILGFLVWREQNGAPGSAATALWISTLIAAVAIVFYAQAMMKATAAASAL